MTSLAFHHSGTCTLCGCRIRGIMVGSFAVNKNSLRATSPNLTWIEPRCPECGFETHSSPSRWRPAPESDVKITAARAKRGWAA